MCSSHSYRHADKSKKRIPMRLFYLVVGIFFNMQCKNTPKQGSMEFLEKWCLKIECIFSGLVQAQFFCVNLIHSSEKVKTVCPERLSVFCRIEFATMRDPEHIPLNFSFMANKEINGLTSRMRSMFPHRNF